MTSRPHGWMDGLAARLGAPWGRARGGRESVRCSGPAGDPATVLQGQRPGRAMHSSLAGNCYSQGICGATLEEGGHALATPLCSSSRQGSSVRFSPRAQPEKEPRAASQALERPGLLRGTGPLGSAWCLLGPIPHSFV